MMASDLDGFQDFEQVELRMALKAEMQRTCPFHVDLRCFLCSFWIVSDGM